jgi:hypothetical protein
MKKVIKVKAVFMINKQAPNHQGQTPLSTGEGLGVRSNENN